jgi:hypothetical protein
VRVSEPAESTALIYLPDAARSGCRRWWKGVTVSKAGQGADRRQPFFETELENCAPPSRWAMREGGCCRGIGRLLCSM